MKIQCDICRQAEAELLCCADEAVLCKRCDEEVHAANKLSQKHQRLFLLKDSSSCSQLPLCDTCQERKGYLFCLEDRALLCKQCDISTHSTSPYAMSHKRFLISGIKVTLESSAEHSRDQHSRMQMSMESSFYSPPAKESLAAIIMDSEAPSTETMNEIFENTDFSFYDFSEVGSSKIN